MAREELGELGGLRGGEGCGGEELGELGGIGGTISYFILRVIPPSCFLSSHENYSRMYNADSLKLYEHKRFSPDRRCQDLLTKCQHLWDGLSDFRRMRKRCKSYLLGNQWCDEVEYNHHRMSEKDYIERIEGLPALQNNLIGKTVRTVMGLRRQQNTVPLCTAVDSEEAKIGDVFTELLRQNMQLNKRNDANSRQFMEFCMSGLVITKSVWDYNHGKDDVWNVDVNPNYIFFDQGVDYNFDDIHIIGQIHDVFFPEILKKFSKSDADDVALNEIYTQACDMEWMQHQAAHTLISNSDLNTLSFLYPAQNGKCRVIEVWTKETRVALWCHDRMKADSYMVAYAEKADIDAENERRKEQNIVKDELGNPVMDETGNIKTYVPAEELELITYERRVEDFWYYRFLSPLGHVLEEGMSPYRNSGEFFQPYTIKPYPYMDGEIHSFVENIIDQQKFVNHYVIMMDFLMKNAAKGCIVVDESTLSNQMSIDDIKSEYVKTNGVIIINTKQGGSMPQPLQSAQVPTGIEFMINLQKSFVEEVSGVQPALQGKSAQSGTSGFLYQQQVSQATSTIFDLIETFHAFLRDVAMKNLKIMQQYYSDRKCIVISGDKFYYDPERMGGVECDIAISENTDTPIYRAANNELMMNLLNQKIVSLETVLKMGSIPNSDKFNELLQNDWQYLLSKKQALAQEQQVEMQQQQAMNPQMQQPNQQENEYSQENQNGN